MQNRKWGVGFWKSVGNQFIICTVRTQFWKKGIPHLTSKKKYIHLQLRKFHETPKSWSVWIVSLAHNSNTSTISKSPTQNGSLSSKRSSWHCLWLNCLLSYAFGLLRLGIRNGKLSWSSNMISCAKYPFIPCANLMVNKWPLDHHLWHIIFCVWWTFW
jgi:hypothetical protein